MNPREELHKLLLQLFSADELRRVIRYLPDGDHLTARLPGHHASMAQLAHEVVEVLEHDGMLVGPEFWDRLHAERPRRSGEITRVRAQFGNARLPSEGRAPTPPEPAQVPTRPSAALLTVLLVSASPDTSVRLRVDKEFRDIINRARAARHRERLNFVQVQAATFDDLRTALLEHQPHVLHISTHGLEDGSLLFEAAGVGSRIVPKPNLLQLLGLLKDNLRLVVLNACHSHAIARDLPPTIDLAIGMNDAVADDAAINFALALYEALAYARSVETAFGLAVSGLVGRANTTPELFPPAASDPGHKRKQPLLSAQP